ncbi:MAG: aryl-sulfate sulfotransferase [Candidatus Marinimicrobia bacterium]|nr:aryl-sulfate sulfotransferase [Candidatus Neomarinimicrobiota bacterium]
MKIFRFVLLSQMLVFFYSAFAQTMNPYQFISPKPASNMVSKSTNIIFRHSTLIDRSTLGSELIRVEGSKSGNHTGDLILSDDGQTIVFMPSSAFASAEEVRIVLQRGIKTKTGGGIPDYSFSFSTAPEGIEQIHYAPFDVDLLPLSVQSLRDSVLLPAPPITIDSVNNPSPGYIFMATWDRNSPRQWGNFIFILDHNGNIIDSVRVDGAPFDFQVQQNGLLSYARGDFSTAVPLPGEGLKHIVMDNSLAVVDSFQMKNGYSTDFHEFKMLPNGHVMMMSYHSILYDMSTIVEGGQTDAELVINIIQEQDRNKNVVFEWRNIDYIPITDSDLDLTAARINYSTLNAFDVEPDGNILASFRNHSEIMKISRETGEIMWRMGSARGEFSYVGEHEENAPYYHARQHNIRRRPNGNITLFDNGEFHQPPYSRAVEYSLDEENKIATLVSEWRYPEGNIFTVTAGNAELLPGGGWFIGYGVPNPQFVKRNAVEVHADGSIALELSLPSGVLAYRVSKLPWNETVSTPRFTHFEVIQGGTYSFNNESIITGVEIHYNALQTFYYYNEATITRVPYGPVDPVFADSLVNVYPVSINYEGVEINSQEAELHIDLAVYPEIADPENTKLYYRNILLNDTLFVPRPTTYDELNNNLIATVYDFGEIIFGVLGNTSELGENGTETPREYSLTQNFPNPFNPTTTLQFDLPQNSQVSLVVYDMQGRELSTLVDGAMIQGQHNVQWSGVGLSSGIYLARLVTPDYTHSIKMVLLK